MNTQVILPVAGTKSSEPETDNPFVGLRPYEEDESFVFFGRDKQITELLQKLYTTRFIGVIGSSGCGKSSLIKAGLIPKLKAGFLTNERDHWMIASMRPGGNPLLFLADSINESLNSFSVSTKTTYPAPSLSLKHIKEKGSQAVLDYLAEIFKNGRTNLLLLVDQFEELFTTKRKDVSGEVQKNENVIFVNILLTLANQLDTPIYVIITMRSDYIGNCNKFYDLPEILNQGQYLVPRLNRQQLREVIQFPVRLYGGKISERLLDQLLNDSDKDLDQLPVLQHCLMRTYDAWAKTGLKNTMDFKEYEASGKLEHALSDHANEVYNQLEPEQKKIAELIFQSLTDVNADNEPIRRRQSLNQLVDVSMSLGNITENDVRKVIDKFRDPSCAFLMPIKGNIVKESIIDISHESLMRQWDKLKEWMRKEQDSARKFNWLCDSVSNNRELLRGIDLQDALYWRAGQRPSEAWALRYSQNFHEVESYINNSVKKQRTRRVRNYSFAGLFILMITSLTALGFRSQKKDHEHKQQEVVRKKQEELNNANLRFKTDSLAAVRKMMAGEIEQKRLLQTSNEKKDSALAQVAFLIGKLSDEKSRLKAQNEELITEKNISLLQKLPFYKGLDTTNANAAINALLSLKSKGDLKEYEELLDLLNQAVSIKQTIQSDPAEGLRTMKGIWRKNKSPVIDSILLSIVNRNLFFKQRLDAHNSSYLSVFSVSPKRTSFSFSDNDYNDVHTGRYRNDSLVLDNEEDKETANSVSQYAPASLKVMGCTEGKVVVIQETGEWAEWDADRNRKVIGVVQGLNNYSVFQISPDGNSLLAANLSKGTVRIWNNRDVRRNDNTGKLTDTSNRAIKQIEFSPTSDGLYILYADGVLNYKNIADSRDFPARNSPADKISMFSFSSDGRNLITVSNGRLDLRKLNTEKILSSGIDLRTYSPGNIKKIELSPDWKQMLAGYDGYLLYINSTDSLLSFESRKKNPAVTYKRFGIGYTTVSCFINNTSMLSVNTKGNIFLWKTYPEFKNLDDALTKVKIPAMTFKEKLESDLLSLSDIASDTSQEHLYQAAIYYHERSLEKDSTRLMGYYGNAYKKLSAVNKFRISIETAEFLYVDDNGQRTAELKKITSLGEAARSKKDFTNEDRNQLSTQYGNLSFGQLFIKEFKGAIQSASRGIELDSTSTWIYTNLALGYLLTNQFVKAEFIYMKYRDSSYALPGETEKSFITGFLGDFDALEAQGIISANQKEIYREVQKIKAILRK